MSRPRPGPLLLGAGLALFVLCAALSPALAQDPRPGGAVGEAGPVGNMGRFGAGIALSEAGLAAVEGDVDAVEDAAALVASPEFYASLAVFELSRAGGDALASRVGGSGRLVGALKHNLVMAGAMTAVSAIEVDLGGFTPGDALRGDFSELREARVGLRDVDAQDVGITLGAFAVAQPVWSRIRSLGGRFAQAVGRRFLRTAAVKGALAVAPVPGSRVVAGLMTVADVALAVVDVAGVIATARVIEEPAREWNDERRAEQALRRRSAALRDALRAGDQAGVEAAIEDLQAAFDANRSLRDLPLIMDTLALQRRLERWGEPRAELDRLAAGSIQDYGQRLALQGHAARLLEEYGARAAAGDVRGGDAEAFREALARHQGRLREHLQDPAQDERRRLFAQEEDLLRSLAERSRDPQARAALLAAAEEAAANAWVDGALRESLLQPLPEPAQGPGLTDSLQAIAGQG